MHRIKRIYSILIAVTVLSGCGQVGVITGGDKDTIAPKPLVDRVIPPNASLNSKPKQIQIPFNEYIQLVNPLENIRVTPNTLTVEASIKNKTLVLDLSGEYLENTTYSIEFNRAIQDITEKNDSIFSYVFSTGPIIDKNKASFIVIDGFKKQPVSKITVGLFDSIIELDNIKQPLYKTSTSKNGEANFEYIKSQNYYVYAYDDIDQNGTLTIGERAGLIDSVYFIGDTIGLKSMIKISEQEQPFKLSTDFLPPSTWKIWSNVKLDSLELEFLTPKPSFVHYNDTILAFYKNEKLSALQLSYKQDTLTKRVKSQQIELTTNTNLLDNHLRYNQPLSVFFNDAIDSIDYTKILIDGNSIESNQTSLNSDKLSLSLENDFFKDTSELYFLPKSIKFLSLEQNDTLKFTVHKQQMKDVGNLVVLADSLFKPGILQLMLGEKVVAESKTDTTTTAINFKELQPNTYSFRFIEDTNKDGKWTPGNVYNMTLPENIIWFTSSSKVRANWDVEVKLTF